MPGRDPWAARRPPAPDRGHDRRAAGAAERQPTATAAIMARTVTARAGIGRVRPSDAPPIDGAGAGSHRITVAADAATNTATKWPTRRRLAPHRTTPPGPSGTAATAPAKAWVRQPLEPRRPEDRAGHERHHACHHGTEKHDTWRRVEWDRERRQLRPGMMQIDAHDPQRPQGRCSISGGVRHRCPQRRKGHAEGAHSRGQRRRGPQA